MDSLDTQGQSTSLVLLLKSGHDQIKSADLEEKTDELTTAPAIVTIRVTEPDDPALEGDTLVEIRNPISDANSTFNEKEWSDFLAKTNLFEPQARSRSCNGRIQGNANTDTSLHKKLELRQYVLEEQPLCSENCSERLKTPEGPSKDHKTSTRQTASAANTTTSFRSTFTDRRGSNHGRSPPPPFEDGSILRGRSSLRSMGADRNQVHLTLNIHRNAAVLPKSSDQDQKSLTQKGLISLLDIFNELVRGCNVTQFSTDSSMCFAKNKKTDQRCSRAICKKGERSKIAQQINQQIAELIRFYVAREGLASAKSHLKNFINLAICSRTHREEYHAAVDNIDQSHLCSTSDPIDRDFGVSKQEEPVETSDTDSSATDSISALAKFNEIFPQAKQWFDNAPNKCVWRKVTKAENDRCGNPIAATHKNMVDELFEKLRNMCFRQRTMEASQCIRELADLAFCSRHHSRKARSRIQKFLPESLPQSHGESILSRIKHEEKDNISHESIDRLQNVPHIMQGANSAKALISIPPDPANDSYNFSQEAATRRPNRIYLVYIPKLIPYDTRVSRVVADDGEWILMQARRELTKLELNEGYVYAYWNRTTFGTYKIGYTTGKVGRRLVGWENKCKHEAKRVYPLHDEAAVPVPHVRRVEALIHADLRKYRVVEHGCQGCHGSHWEWFKGINDKLVKCTIEKYTNWIMTKPYKKSGGKWVLCKAAENALIEMWRETANGQSSVNVRVSEANSRKPNPRLDNSVMRRRSQRLWGSNEGFTASYRYDLRSRRTSARLQNAMANKEEGVTPKQSL